MRVETIAFKYLNGARTVPTLTKAYLTLSRLSQGSAFLGARSRLQPRGMTQ